MEWSSNFLIDLLCETNRPSVFIQFIIKDLFYKLSFALDFFVFFVPNIRICKYIHIIKAYKRPFIAPKTVP